MAQSRLSRRAVAGLAGVVAILAPTLGHARSFGPFGARIGEDLAAYDGFGWMRSGGQGDARATDWLERRLREAGYATTRQALDLPFFEVSDARFTVGGRQIACEAQPPSGVTGEGGVTAPLVDASDSQAAAPVHGKIALVVLPFARHSSLGVAGVARLRELEAAGCAGVIMVTVGPSGEPIVFNVPHDFDLARLPVMAVASHDVAALQAAARGGESATLIVRGAKGRRPAYNLIATAGPPGSAGLVLSTPKSGWFNCAAERGPGVSAFLALAEWAARALPRHPKTLIATSGHEFENHGAQLFLDERAPRPDRVRLWVHLGAGFGARDYHDGPRGVVSALPSADPQRFLVAGETLQLLASRAFAGLIGLERVYPDGERTAGELRHIKAAGYKNAIGVFGAHRFHHTRVDRLDKTGADLVRPVAAAFREVIAQTLR
jgi:hypothetical protein